MSSFRSWRSGVRTAVAIKVHLGTSFPSSRRVRRTPSGPAPFRIEPVQSGEELFEPSGHCEEETSNAGTRNVFDFVEGPGRYSDNSLPRDRNPAFADEDLKTIVKHVPILVLVPMSCGHRQRSPARGPTRRTKTSPRSVQHRASGGYGCHHLRSPRLLRRDRCC